MEEDIEKIAFIMPDGIHHFLRMPFGIKNLGMQQHDKRLHPVAYTSKKLVPGETKYSTLKKECLGIVWSITKFRLYLAGKPHILQTDHEPLAHTNKSKYQNNCIMRCTLALQRYQYPS